MTRDLKFYVEMHKQLWYVLVSCILSLVLIKSHYTLTLQPNRVVSYPTIILLSKSSTLG